MEIGSPVGKSFLMFRLTSSNNNRSCWLLPFIVEMSGLSSGVSCRSRGSCSKLKDQSVSHKDINDPKSKVANPHQKSILSGPVLGRIEAEGFSPTLFSNWMPTFAPLHTQSLHNVHHVEKSRVKFPEFAKKNSC